MPYISLTLFYRPAPLAVNTKINVKLSGECEACPLGGDKTWNLAGFENTAPCNECWLILSRTGSRSVFSSRVKWNDSLTCSFILNELLPDAILLLNKFYPHCLKYFDVSRVLSAAVMNVLNESSLDHNKSLITVSDRTVEASLVSALTWECGPASPCVPVCEVSKQPSPTLWGNAIECNREYNWFICLHKPVTLHRV